MVNDSPEFQPSGTLAAACPSFTSPACVEENLDFRVLTVAASGFRVRAVPSCFAVSACAKKATPATLLPARSKLGDAAHLDRIGPGGNDGICGACSGSAASAAGGPLAKIMPTIMDRNRCEYREGRSYRLSV